MKTLAVIVGIAGIVAGISLPAINASRMAAQRSLENARMRLQELEPRASGPLGQKMVDSTRSVVAASEGSLQRATLIWWAALIASITCFLAALILFFWPSNQRRSR